MGKVNLFGEEEKVESKYTNKVGIPQYLPSSEAPPSIRYLYDDRKYQELCTSIEQSNLPEDEKMFLKLAAARHIVFKYSKIADYYAHASKEMQEEMEKSALVIIDFNDAIANGYVKLSKKISQIMDESGVRFIEDEKVN